MINNNSRITDIDECIKKGVKKLKEIENYLTYSEEQMQGS